MSRITFASRIDLGPNTTGGFYSASTNGVGQLLRQSGTRNKGLAAWVVRGKVVDNTDGDGYVQIARHPWYIASMSNEDGTPYFGLVNKREMDNNPAVEQSTHLHVYYFDSNVQTVSGERLGNTTVNLFDYWTDESENGRSAVDFARDDWEAWNTGINKNHEFKFRANANYGGDNGDYTNGLHLNKRNFYSSKDKKVVSYPNGTIVQGILANMLGGDGYPQLSGNGELIADVAGDTGRNTSKESLAYLFNPDVATNDGENYKASFTNVQGLFQKNKEGYWYYDSQSNYAQLDEEENKFRLYATSGIIPSTSGGEPGQFYPFNNFNSARSSASRVQNHWFGMSMTTRFAQMHGGFTDSSRATPVSFHFSGDDDVWIFIDDVLIADIGGVASKRGVNIDFSTGEVTIENVEGSKDDIAQTTIASQFEAAYGEEYRQRSGGANQWNGNTFADNTYHTMKFYFFERGNTDSNLSLNFNLLDVQPTSVYKVDQFGNAVTGAEFGVYAANEAGRYLTDAGGSVVTAGPDEDPLDSMTVHTELMDSKNVTVHTTSARNTWYYDDGWNIHYIRDGSESVIHNLYHGRTDGQGSMPFIGENKKPLGLEDIRDQFGEYFMLREVQVPAGYRTVSEDIRMRVDGDILRCLDTYRSGVWSAPTAKVLALNELTVAGETPERVIDYYQTDTKRSNGTLFATVLKRNGKSPDATDLQSMQCDDWDVVRGNGRDGYAVVPVERGVSNLQQAIDAAKTYTDSTGAYTHAFTKMGAGMQVTLEELPGDQAQYYTHVLGNVRQGFTDATAGAKQVEYVVAYYWTSADSLDGAVPGNTVRVVSHDMRPESLDPDTTSYHEFVTQWGATIEIPNVENRIYFQKLAEGSSRENTDDYIAGAVFAMYPVGEDSANAMYYVATDGTRVYLEPDTDLDNTGTAYVGGPQGSGTAAKWTLETGEYRVSNPPRNDGDDARYVKRKGGGAYGVIRITDSDGKELNVIKPATNARNVDLVGITHHECRTVGENGTGYMGLMEHGMYVMREIEPPAGYERNTTETEVLVNSSGIHADAGVADNGVAVGNGLGRLTGALNLFASPNGIDETLRYVSTTMDVKENGSFADFAGGDWKTTGQTGERDARLYTQSGWSRLNARQDSQRYHSDDAHTQYANYTNLGEQNIAGLFSHAVFVQVTDKPGYELPSAGGTSRSPWAIVVALGAFAGSLAIAFMLSNERGRWRSLR